RAPRNFAGDINATMTVWYGPDSDKSQEVNFTITVMPAPYMHVSPDSHDFGVVAPGNLVQIPAIIYNTGSDSLSIDSLSTDNTDTTITNAPALPFTINPGANQPVTINFNTTGQSGIVRRLVTVTSDNAYSEGTQTVAVSGMVGSGAGETDIVSGDSSQEDPHLYGTKLVYRDNSGGHLHIYLKDLSTGNVTQLTTDTDNLYWTPRIYGRYVVWVQRPATGTIIDNEIYLLDLDNIENPPTRLTNDSLTDSHPRIWGDYIVWQKRITEEPNRSDIYLYQISTGNTARLTNTPNDNEGYPEIHGNYAVWYDQSDRVFRHTLSSGSTSQMAALDLDYIEDLKTNDNRIVWIDEVDAEDDYYDVFVYYDDNIANLSQNYDAMGEEEATIWGDNVIYLADDNRLYKVEIGGSGPAVFVSDTADKEDIYLYDATVVWEDYRNGNADIYMKSLNTENAAIKPNNIVFTPSSATDSEIITITASIQNLGENTLNNILVRFFEGDPTGTGVQISTDQTISSILAGNMGPANVSWQASTNGTIPIYMVIDPNNTIAESNELDNTAFKTITISDNDNDGPVIENIAVEEYNGDSDGLVEDNEQVRISWSASDPSGISQSICTVNETQHSATGAYEVVVGPFATGAYDYTISVQDGDNSPSSSQESRTFTVYSHAPSVLGVNPSDGATNVILRPVIVITFDESLNPSTITENTTILKDSASDVVTGTVSNNVENNSIDFIPDNDLTNSEVYTVTVVGGDNGVNSENGNTMDSSFVSSFTVEPDIVDPIGVVTYPLEGDNIGGVINILGTAWDRNFNSYQVFFGVGADASSWIPITQAINTTVTSGPLGQWDTRSLDGGLYSLKLVVVDKPPASNQYENVISPVRVDPEEPTMETIAE
ncbi:Ig-like domain-containing protein, partial [Chloroflexota bacterium]